MKRPDTKLVLVGKKEYFYEELEARTRAAGVEDVIFTGFIPDEELAWLYDHAKLFVTASFSEGFGLPGLEAMNSGLPVLSSNASCLPEVYGDGAEYFDPMNVDELATKMTALLDDSAELARLRAAGAAQVQRYSWEKMARETLAVYESAIIK